MEINLANSDHASRGTGIARRSIGGALLAAAAGAAFSQASASEGPRAVEVTFLKSIDPDPTALATFIRQNWFAMDEIARLRGLMTDYRMLVAEDEGDWNVMVLVGYPTKQGFDAIREEWRQIVSAHVVVPVGGKLQRDLGRVVGSRRLFPT